VNPARDALLLAARNRWLSEHLPRYRFVRSTVARFMPGEGMEDGLEAAARLAEDGIPATFTFLGEGVHSAADADAVALHYRQLLDLIGERGLDAEISVKPTHLGLDQDPEATLQRLRDLATRSAVLGKHLFLDMEAAPYVEPTLAIYRQLREEFENTGVCIQAYLHRTPQDVADLLAAGASVRLVKGAYREPRQVAIHDHRLIRATFEKLALEFLPRRGAARRDRAARVRGRLRTRLLRDPDALRHPRGRPASSRTGGVSDPRADQLRHPLVPVVHATRGRTSGTQRLARDPQPARAPVRAPGRHTGALHGRRKSRLTR
jgi:proline dehydrogenase